MYKVKDNSQPTFLDFNQPLGMHLNPDNRWVKLAEFIPWDEYEVKYAKLFKSQTGNVAKPFRMALGSLIIQKKLGYTDRELVQEIIENPYLQYFIGLPGYQETAPFDPSVMVDFRKRINLDIAMFLNESMLKKAESDDSKDKKSDKKDHHDKGCGGSSGTDTTDGINEKDNSGTMILDATCAPSNIRYPQDFSLLNEARKKLEELIRKICRMTREKQPRTYCREARKNYLNLAKTRKRSVKKVRSVIRKQLGYVKRDLGYIFEYQKKGYEPTDKEKELLDTIHTLYTQQKQMYDQKTHQVADRIVSLSQPYIRPIVRGKVKAPVEFGAKFDMSVDEEGYARIEKISFDPYNESSVLIQAAESYKERTGHYPERILADQIYRNRINRKFCNENGIRLSGPKLGRPGKTVNLSKKKTEYRDNVDRIEVERDFSLCKRCYGLGLIRTKLKETTYGAIGMSIFVSNLFRLLNRYCLLFFTFFKEHIYGRKVCHGCSKLTIMIMLEAAV
jgi:Transposase domain (DUF772).